MTFENQINALTGIPLGGSGTATTTDATQYLQDGLREVINRIIRLAPDETIKFCKTTSDDSNAGIVYTGKIFSVVREHDSTSVLRKCSLISADNRYDATDPESIYYRSKYNPGYYINGSTNAHGSKIYSVPESASGNNAVIVTQVYYDTGLTTSDDNIDNFPSEYQYLVVLYAASKVLENKINSLNIIEEDTELGKSLTDTLNAAKSNYELAFNKLNKPQPEESK